MLLSAFLQPKTSDKRFKQFIRLAVLSYRSGQSLARAFLDYAVIGVLPVAVLEQDELYACLERDGERANHTSGNRWQNEELEKLGHLPDKQATQQQSQAALPVRSWEAIHKKIVKLHGDSSMVTETGQMDDRERISDYLKRNPETAAAMVLPFLGNYSRRIRC